MISYTTKITEIRTHSYAGFDDVIKEVDWVLTAVDGTVSFNVASTSTLLDPVNGVIQLNNVTEQQVLSWIENTPEYLTGKAHLASRVAEQLSRELLVPQPLPWVTTPTE